MKKQKINVIDLDKTLVSFDTFRELVLREIKKGKFIVVLLTVLRISRLISSSNYKMRVQKYLQKNYSKSFFEEYADEIYQKINPKVLALINQNTDKDTINILLSASPDDYVQLLCEKLSWQGSGSYFDEKNKYHHLYGNEKINWIKEFYPAMKFHYNFSISDSKSDRKLLELFESKIYFEGN
ncbi:MAG TPA: HAD family hydrolase [Bacteroidales bacterium]